MQFTEKKGYCCEKTFQVVQRFSMFWAERERNTHYIHVNDFLKLFVFGNADDCSVFFPRFFPQFTPCFSSLFVILFSSSQKKIEIVYIRVYTLTHNTGRNLHKINQKVNSQNSVVRYWIPYLFCRQPQKGTLKLCNGYYS